MSIDGMPIDGMPIDGVSNDGMSMDGMLMSMLGIDGMSTSMLGIDGMSMDGTSMLGIDGMFIDATSRLGMEMVDGPDVAPAAKAAAFVAAVPKCSLTAPPSVGCAICLVPRRTSPSASSSSASTRPAPPAPADEVSRNFVVATPAANTPTPPPIPATSNIGPDALSAAGAEDRPCCSPSPPCSTCFGNDGSTRTTPSPPPRRRPLSAKTFLTCAIF